MPTFIARQEKQRLCRCRNMLIYNSLEARLIKGWQNMPCDGEKIAGRD